MFLIWYLGFHGCLCITICTLLGHIIHNSSQLFPHTILDSHIFSWQDFRVKHGSHLCFLLCFSLFFLVIWKAHFLYKYGSHLLSRLEEIRTRTPTNLPSYLTIPPRLACNATPSHLRSILHIAVKIVLHSHIFEHA